MKKLYQIIDKIDLKISTIIILIIGILIGRAKQLLLLFLIALIHELFHLIVSKVYKAKIKSFEILPFGACLSIDNVEKLNSIKQIIIYIAGPLSCFFNLPIINVLYRYEFLNKVNYDFLININYTMFFVNLLPIIPLDGYMIIKAIFQLIFPFKKALKISYLISIITFIGFIFYNFISFQPTITIFLFFEQIKQLLFHKKIYQSFLIGKMFNKKEKNYKIISNYQMYKDVNNYKVEKNKILVDSDIAAIELQKIK